MSWSDYLYTTRSTKEPCEYGPTRVIYKVSIFAFPVGSGVEHAIRFVAKEINKFTVSWDDPIPDL
jgi:hypothetical protein